MLNCAYYIAVYKHCVQSNLTHTRVKLPINTVDVYCNLPIGSDVLLNGRSVLNTHLLVNVKDDVESGWG